MCEIYGFCGKHPTNLNKYTDAFWTHARIHQDGFGYFLADKNDLYVNPASALTCIDKLNKKDFTSSLALCHIRFKTHGEATRENCHPFIKYDTHDVQWALIHNGYVFDNDNLMALTSLQVGQTDSERILLNIIEGINSFYEHTFITDKTQYLEALYLNIAKTLSNMASLGKTNLIFTDNYTHNMYVYMNSPKTLWYLLMDDGIHFSTTKLTNESWIPVLPYKLHIFNSGICIY